MGALFGEALIINNQDLQKDFRYIQKQKGGLFAKGRLLGLQFKTLFTDKLYFEIGRTMNETAKMIRKGFSDRGFSFFMESETNQSFPIIENGAPSAPRPGPARPSAPRPRRGKLPLGSFLIIINIYFLSWY